MVHSKKVTFQCIQKWEVVPGYIKLESGVKGLYHEFNPLLPWATLIESYPTRLKMF